ncbi:hypothetical protein [Pelagibacterium sp. H642]|uniref:hypothetical protein n=1 Tax=Pelagibacterium sp. H642 TaxID=1881069 RepID=UPI002814A540|nr:hypothetical protein [Pelagibacterium sp. H642]WMT90125.1 hypothetical protein NO934_15200 [Pelagibacterium sp. H642]
MSSIPLKWQRVAVERAAIGARASAGFHEERGDDQAKVARQYADSLDAAALTLKALEIEGGLSQAQQRRAS